MYCLGVTLLQLVRLDLGKVSASPASRCFAVWDLLACDSARFELNPEVGTLAGILLRREVSPSWLMGQIQVEEASSTEGQNLFNSTRGWKVILYRAHQCG